MRKPASLLAVVQLLAATSASAGASFVNTPPLLSNMPGAASLACEVANTGSKDATVTVEIIDAASGTILASHGPTTLSARRVTFASTTTTTSNSYCRFTGLKSKYATASYFALDGTGKTLAVVTAP